MILVSGGTGRVGRQLVRLLGEREVSFKVLCRKPEQARLSFKSGVQLVQGYLEDYHGLLEVLQGVETVFMLSSDNPRQVELQSNLIRAARSSEVRRVVKLSMLGAMEDSPIGAARMHWQTEQELSQSGLEWTVLRPNFFCQNFLDYAGSIRSESKIYAPAGTGRASVVDARDVAWAAAETLTSPGHAGRVYDLTGPEELSYADAARLISAVIGTRVVYRSISPEDARRRLQAEGWPAWMVDDRLERYRYWADNNAAPVTGVLEKLIRRPPTSFARFVRDHASVFLPAKQASRNRGRH